MFLDKVVGHHFVSTERSVVLAVANSPSVSGSTCYLKVLMILERNPEHLTKTALLYTEQSQQDNSNQPLGQCHFWDAR